LDRGTLGKQNLTDFEQQVRHSVAVEFEPCPVGGDNYHGQVERRIREVQKLFDAVYKGVKLDILGFETAFAWVSNELKISLSASAPCTRTSSPLNRWIHGRANKPAPLISIAIEDGGEDGGGI
jgi:hypothetical protein